MKVMESSGRFLMDGKVDVDVDETYVGGHDQGVIGRKGGRKKIVVLAIEKQGIGVSRMYARVIDSASKENLKEFMKDHIKVEAKVPYGQMGGLQGDGKGIS